MIRRRRSGEPRRRLYLGVDGLLVDTFEIEQEPRRDSQRYYEWSPHGHRSLIQCVAPYALRLLQYALAYYR